MSSEMLKEFDLAQSPLREDLLAEDIGDLLDGHSITSRIVGGRTRISTYGQSMCRMPSHNSSRHPYIMFLKAIDKQGGSQENIAYQTIP